MKRITQEIISILKFSISKNDNSYKFFKEFLEIYKIIQIIQNSNKQNLKARILFIDLFSWNGLISFLLQKFYPNSHIIPIDIQEIWSLKEKNIFWRNLKNYFWDKDYNIISKKLRNNYKNIDILNNFNLLISFIIDRFNNWDFDKIILIGNHGCKQLSVNFIKLVNILSEIYPNKVNFIIQPCCEDTYEKSEEIKLIPDNIKISAFNISNLFSFLSMKDIISIFLEKKGNYLLWKKWTNKYLDKVSYNKILINQKWLISYHDWVEHLANLLNKDIRINTKWSVGLTYKNLIFYKM